MNKYLITKCFKQFVVWRKTFWGWSYLKDGSDAVLYFDSAEDAERHLTKINMLHGLYPIVKELSFSRG